MMALKHLLTYGQIGILAFVLVFSPFPSWGHAETLRIGIFHVRPHMMISKKSPGIYKGAAVEYFSHLAKIMKIDVEFYGYPFVRLMDTLAKKRIDAVLMIAKNPAREAMFQYPVKPFCVSQSAIAVSSASSLHAVASVEDLLPLKIGFIAKGYRTPLMSDKRLKLELLHGVAAMFQNFKKLEIGRVDAVYMPDIATLEFEAGEAGTPVRLLPLPEPPTEMYTVFSHQSAEKYLARYERALEELQKTLSYDQFLKEFITTK